MENQSVKITKVYKEAFPKTRFVGICYKNSDRVDGGYGYQWGQFHGEDKFAPLEKLLTDEFKTRYQDAEAYIGLMKNKYGAGDEYFEYWIGMFLPEGCEVPEGYGHVDLSYGYAGISWLQGKEWEVFCHEGDAYKQLMEHGMTIESCEDGGCYFFERYVCPRFTTPNENEEIILDIGFFVS